MASTNDDSTNGCVFLWKIEDISYCWFKSGEAIVSPSFTALEGTKWSLKLNCIGNNIGLFLTREKYCKGPKIIEFSYHIGFLDKDGLYLQDKKMSTRLLQKGERWGFQDFVTREEVFITQKEAYIPGNTLTVQCIIWKNEEKFAFHPNPLIISARTVFKVNRKSFVWLIDKFNTIKPGKRNKFKDDLIDFDLVVNETTAFVKKLDIDIISINKSIEYFLFKTDLIVSEGEEEDSQETCAIEYYGRQIKAGTLSTLKLMDNESRYLLNGDLLLKCEYVSSNGCIKHEVCGFGIIFPTPKHDYSVKKGKKSFNSSIITNDLKTLYTDKIFCDIEIHTLTNTFPAHKNILSARSPVFRTMFSSDMKEKNSGRIDIIDLDDDTMHRMLLYIYTDILEDLSFENAYKLYEAADKYEILSLRSRCTSVLVKNLSPSKACDVLILANRHNDVYLQKVIGNYLVGHDRLGFLTKKFFALGSGNIS